MAAADVAQFLWKKFLRSLVDAESELSEMLMPWNASWEVNTYVRANTYLSELNYALAECQIFAKECRELKKKILPLNPSAVFFILQMKKRLMTLRRKFETLVLESPSISTSILREGKGRNSVECLGFTEKDIVVLKKNSEETVVFSDAMNSEDFTTMVELLGLLGGSAAGIGFTSIGIVGMAGVGKSILVQRLVEETAVLSEFSPIIQLCLSDIIQEHNVVDNTNSASGASISISIVKLILVKLGEEETAGISGLELNSLLERLNHLLSGKKYLIVLDDVWHNMEFYRDLGYQLPDGEKFGDRLSDGLPKDGGGAVIVVSRIPEVALDMVGICQSTLHKRLTMLKRKSAVSSLVHEQQKRQTPISNTPSPSISTPKEKTSVAEECLPFAEKVKNISSENVPLLNVGIYSEFKDSRMLVGDPTGTGFTAIGIVGMAGVGKSTFVHNVLKTVWSEYDPIVWLCLSDIIKGRKQGPNVTASHEVISISIVACILEMLGISIARQDLGIAELLERLNHILSGKRYLIVLDDVWDIMEFCSDLSYKLPEGEKIGDQLSQGLPKDCGGTVIVTSRITEVAQHMVGLGQNNLFLVTPWDRGQCLLYFDSFIFHERLRCGKEKRFGVSNTETVRKVHNEILDQVCGLPLMVKTLAYLIFENQISQNDYSRSALKKMLIPREFLIDCSWEYVPINERNFDWAHDKMDMPKCPVFVFIDFQSDLIGALAEDFRYQLNRVQVLSVLHESFITRRCSPMKPERALEEFYGSLAKLKGEGHDFADEIQKKMTFIIVGGDVFVNWFLGVLCDLKLPDSPSIVPIALGIKSNIPFSFGWEFDAMKPVNKILETVLNHTKHIKTDSWHILIKMEAAIPTDYQEIPYCLQLCHPVHKPNMENVDNQPLIRGEFWNYFSFGVDDPRLYGALRFRHISRTLNRLLAKVEVLKHHGDQWKTLSIPSSIRSIVCLNLPSFVGGLNPWSKANVKKDQSIDLTPSLIDDGRLEIIGSRDDLLCPKKRWIRLDQVREIRFKFIGDSAEVINMMIDGVPLKKSRLDGLDAIEISHHRQVNILVEQNYSANSIHDS
ncbi:uncharacterized protein LOC133725705 isoform X2 [Rosa rugosa]|uniref:uncharacterized protein LOC133725705 isoform X2 n=1 Tax=Rosa rugosa TaxID=74645 RepID=UPI002B407157|nr:uncharacterized protein LOC133725705 isoform X2 [Rosa rugosa]